MNLSSSATELGRFPDFLNGYNGVVCTSCNTVFYGPKGSEIIKLRERNANCPICEGKNVLRWIVDDTQPKGERDVEE